MISDDQALAADGSIGQQTVFVPEETLGGELSKFGETSTTPDQAAAVNVGEQGPSSVSESVSYPDATTIQHIVGDAVSSGRENVIQEERPRTYPLTTTEGREGLNAGIPEILTHNSVVVEYLRAEYNRRAQLRPLFWVNTMQLPLEKVYTRLKIVSRQTGGNQGETDVFSVIKENKNGMAIILMEI
ncbi:PREDICTED: uncharacterized protein LOC107329975 [Acropora digitifera]|uniref:uncharacterized protein LOC107329975 n=1 Tax=Acropora digitifera TaxID=70779 RepID=UPI00077AC825|nr:PREDICTED: uncharacterized protein LOC107329975 [Acropora digitifera]